MNLYEISATLENGAVHKTKIYEINQERALTLPAPGWKPL